MGVSLAAAPIARGGEPAIGERNFSSRPDAIWKTIKDLPSAPARETLPERRPAALNDEELAAALLGMKDPDIEEARKRGELVEIDCGKQETA